MKNWIRNIILVVIVVGVGAAAWYERREGTSSTAGFRTAAVTRGDLVATISATGTVEPEEVIDVGAQVAGQINVFGKDKAGKAIDYGSVVEEGMVLAQIDDSLYTADVAQVTAQLAQAQAGVKRAEADLGQMKAKLVQAQRDWERAQKLGPSDALAQTNYDAYEAAYESARATVGVGEAAVVQAQGAVDQAQANLTRAQRNLSYTTIKSPVNGVIIDRRVNIGQTVVASLNAPSLFLIAKDLKHMQVWVSVNEADIGQIHAGQAVTFTADAFPGQTFKGEVGKIRLNATMTQNVVTYTVEVLTDNSSGKLLPYLTANVQFEVARRENVLLVPNVALRWQPSTAEQVAAEFRSSGAKAGGGRPRGEQAGAAGTTQPSTMAAGSRQRGTLWVQQGDYVKPISVGVGRTDGSNTEVSSPELSEGVAVVTGEARAGQASDDARNPFLPQMPQRRQPGGAGSTGAGGSQSGQGATGGTGSGNAGAGNRGGQ